MLFVLAGLLAGFGALKNVVRTAIVPNPRLGDVEAGAVASLTSPLLRAVGGIACVAAAGLVVLAFPALARYDKDEAIAALAP